MSPTTRRRRSPRPGGGRRAGPGRGGAGPAGSASGPSPRSAAQRRSAGPGAGQVPVFGHGDDGEVEVGPLLDTRPGRRSLEGGVAGVERGVLVAPDVAVPLDVVAQLGQPAEDVLVEDAGALGVVGGQVVAVGHRGQHHRHPGRVPVADRGRSRRRRRRPPGTCGAARRRRGRPGRRCDTSPSWSKWLFDTASASSGTRSGRSSRRNAIWADRSSSIPAGGGYPGQCVTVSTVPGAGEPSRTTLGRPSSSWYGTNFTTFLLGERFS